MNKPKWLQSPIKGLLIDISGVLINGDSVIPGSVAAIKRLQSIKFPFRLVTNETQKPPKTIISTVQNLGYDLNETEIFSPVPALIEILKKEKLRPHLLVHPRILPEFSAVDTSDPNCVVVADAAEYINYEALNDCFKTLMSLQNPLLFSLGQGKYYLDEVGLCLDVGSFSKSLEYAADVKARVVGKPSADYFLGALRLLNLKPHEVAMIGDDIQFDVGGAQSCGLRGVLVRTGKYRVDRDEPHDSVVPDAVVDNLLEAVNVILDSLSSAEYSATTMN